MSPKLSPMLELKVPTEESALFFLLPKPKDLGDWGVVVSGGGLLKTDNFGSFSSSSLSLFGALVARTSFPRTIPGKPSGSVINSLNLAEMVFPAW